MINDIHQSTSIKSCEDEPIHVINRIQPCGYLLVVNRDLAIIQCSVNVVELISINNSRKFPPQDSTPISTTNESSVEQILDKEVIGQNLSIFLDEEAIEQVTSVINTSYHKELPMNKNPSPTDTSRNFLIRFMGTFIQSQASCSVVQSGENFLIELETKIKMNTTLPVPDEEGQNVMLFMEQIAKELRKCWSIEEMASIVCSKIMDETPYDRGMVYRFDHDWSGEIIYEQFRKDAKHKCKKDSWLGLRFPATDIPKIARDLFYRNTLRFIYDVTESNNGKDPKLYPSKVQDQYTNLEFCRLRGSSYNHLKYLVNMGVTSTMVIGIIVNKRLWGMYSFHGYREPLVPSTRTRFLCEMAGIMTSMIMESLTRMNDHTRIMEIDKSLVHLSKSSLTDFLKAHYENLLELLEAHTISIREHEPFSIHTFGPQGLQNNNNNDDDNDGNENLVSHVTEEVFTYLHDTYGPVCNDYGVVFIDEQKSNPVLSEKELFTLAFYHLPGLDVLVTREPTIERVQWLGDPDKKLEPNGTLNPRNSFASYVKKHKKQGKPWLQIDRQMVNRLMDQIEKNRSQTLFKEHTSTIMTLQKEKKKAIDDAKVNFDFFAHMAHELRTPFHGILGSLEAMREDPNLADNELLRTAQHCGKNMIKILDDILLVAKGSYSLIIEEQTVNIQEFFKQTLGDMKSYAYVEGQLVRIRKEDIIHTNVKGDFNRVRQIVNNLISNAIKFSEDDIHIEIIQRKTFADVVTVWRTYSHLYPHSQPNLRDLAKMAETDPSSSSGEKLVWTIISVFDRGIGISAPNLKRLGKAFTQLSAGRQKKYQGTGLGINICNMLVDALKGKMVMFSVVENGSCFTFAIPVKIARSDIEYGGLDDSIRDEKDRSKRIETLLSDFRSLQIQDEETGKIRFMKVFVVDDSSINRKLATRKIKRLLPDLTIVQCSSGNAALSEYEYAHENTIGIFMDYHMAGMDGDEATRQIREFERMHDLKKVYIAGYTADILEDSTRLLLQAGMDSIIPKPEPSNAVELELRGMIDSYQRRLSSIVHDE